MANHLSAVKTKLALLGFSTQPFEDPRIKYFQKAIILHRPLKASLKKIIDIDTLQLIARACDSTYMGQVFKAIYTLAFFSFLRMLNLVPHTRKTYSPLYHLARADVFFATPGIHLLLKWSKTLQNKDSVRLLKIPVLGSIYFIYLFGVLRRQHCTGHITTGSWKGRGNQYIEFARVVYCKLPTNGKQLPAFPLKAITGIEPQPQRWEARVLPVCHRGPSSGFEPNLSSHGN